MSSDTLPSGLAVCGCRAESIFGHPYVDTSACRLPREEEKTDHAERDAVVLRNNFETLTGEMIALARYIERDVVDIRNAWEEAVTLRLARPRRWKPYGWVRDWMQERLAFVQRLRRDTEIGAAPNPNGLGGVLPGEEFQ